MNLLTLYLIKYKYHKIIAKTNADNINIWNEYYPYEMFKEDIEEKNLYLLTNKDEIVAVFALFRHFN